VKVKRELPARLDELVTIISAYIEHKVDHFTLQTYGGGYINGPYVQALQEHDNVLLIEASSNDFLNPPIEESQQQIMLFLGWRFYPERYLPNYAQFVDQSTHSPWEIAEIMVKALHFGYGVDETYDFEIRPKLDLVNNLLFDRK
jgi:hypothetical protein